MIIYYHDDCVDGFASSILMEKLLNSVLRSVSVNSWKKEGQPKVTCVPIRYNSKVPSYTEDNSLVVFVDFCPDTEFLISQKIKVPTIIVDHHPKVFDVSSMFNLRDAEHLIFFAAEDKCGTKLVLNEADKIAEAVLQLTTTMLEEEIKHVVTDAVKNLNLYSSVVSSAVTLINDYDLWEHKFPETMYLNSYLRFVGVQPVTHVEEEWKRCLFTEAGFNNAIKVGKELRESFIEEVQKEIRKIYMFSVDFRVAYLSTEAKYVNDASTMILDKNPDIELVVCYYEADSGYKYSLRTRPGSDIDANKIAKKYGGGGHPSASGMYVSETLHPLILKL